MNARPGAAAAAASSSSLATCAEPCTSTLVRVFQSKIVSLDLVEVDVAGELHGGEVDDADGVAGVGALEAHTQRVELTVVGEDLEGLLGVVGGVQQLPVGVQDTLKPLGGGGEREGAEGTTLAALAHGVCGDLLGDQGHGTTGVIGG